MKRYTILLFFINFWWIKQSTSNNKSSSEIKNKHKINKYISYIKKTKKKKRISNKVSFSIITILTISLFSSVIRKKKKPIIKKEKELYKKHDEILNNKEENFNLFYSYRNIIPIPKPKDLSTTINELIEEIKEINNKDNITMEYENNSDNNKINIKVHGTVFHTIEKPILTQDQFNFLFNDNAHGQFEEKSIKYTTEMKELFDNILDNIKKSKEILSLQKEIIIQLKDIGVYETITMNMNDEIIIIGKSRYYLYINNIFLFDYTDYELLHWLYSKDNAQLLSKLIYNDDKIHKDFEKIQDNEYQLKKFDIDKVKEFLQTIKKNITKSKEILLLQKEIMIQLKDIGVDETITMNMNDKTIIFKKNDYFLCINNIYLFNYTNYELFCLYSEDEAQLLSKLIYNDDKIHKDFQQIQDNKYQLKKFDIDKVEEFLKKFLQTIKDNIEKYEQALMSIKSLYTNEE